MEGTKKNLDGGTGLDGEGDDAFITQAMKKL